MLGRVLRSFREEQGLSQERLGSLAMLHRNYVGSAERGERNVSFDAIERWLAALGLTWAEFGRALDREAERSAVDWRERRVAEARRGYRRPGFGRDTGR
jgi:transcriptional regulator with XRE-family HTH domain